MHTPFVAQRLALLHNRTVSTPNVCSLRETHFTAPTQRPTSTDAHLSSDTERHRSAHICTGVAAIRAYRNAMLRATAYSTKYIKAAFELSAPPPPRSYQSTASCRASVALHTRRAIEL
eukprot:1960407-Pleurochrysis_carterae.AAC.1